MDVKRSPTGIRVLREDSIPLNGAQFTQEGYLIDRPIVTTTGIFEYQRPDGTIRRELRLPEDVFEKESLESYKGKPVILTHAGGRIDTSNVQAEHIGTVLSSGWQDGEDVRAEIVIHDPAVVERNGLKELSLGYECEYDETPGEWEGQRYDAIQHKIRINHLAVVHTARAGKKARLNLDGEAEILRGGKKEMAEETRTDGFTPEQAAEFEAFLAWKAAQPGGGGAAAVPAADEGNPADPPKPEEKTDEEIIEQVRSHQDEGEPDDPVSALARSREDISSLLGILDKMKAEKDMGAVSGRADEGASVEEPKQDEGCTVNDEGEPAPEPEKKGLTADSMEEMVRTRVEICRIGDKMHLDGLDSLSIREAKEKIVQAVNPNMVFDGKSDAYVDAAYNMAKTTINRPKDIGYQRLQMAGLASSGVVVQDSADDTKSAASSRQKMIERREHRGGKE